MKRKLLAALLCALFVMFPAGFASGAKKGPSLDAVTDTAKDETVYVTLAVDGSQREINVVNRLETPRDGVYTDYGRYLDVTNLTGDAKPAIDGESISWQLSANAEGFYYLGKLRGGEPPFLFAVRYKLDGVETPADAMAGKKGSAVIHVEVKPNAAADAYFRENYFCQVQAALDLDDCHAIEAKGATRILTGRTVNLGYTALPNREASFDIAFDTASFSFGGLTVTAAPFDQQGMTGIDVESLRSDVDKMADGTQELVDGTQKLKDGLGELGDGVKKLSDGAGDAESSLNQYKKGLKGYTGGVAELAGKARQLSAAMQELAAGGAKLKQGYAALSAGLDATLASFEPMCPPDKAAQIAALRSQLAAYGKGLNDYVDGVSRMAAGMKAFSSGVAKLKNPGTELVSGLSEIISGIAKLADGLSTTAKEMNKLPGEVQKLVDGQTELRDGVLEAKETFSEWDFGADASAKLVSFTSPRNSPRSVQFIYRTAEITVEKVKEPVKKPETKKGFFEKLKELFK